MLIRLSIDFENSAERWWDSGGRDLWESIALDPSDNAVVLDAPIAESWLAQAETLDGWSDGPDYAPHPIAREDVADDEDVPVR